MQLVLYDHEIILLIIYRHIDRYTAVFEVPINDTGRPRFINLNNTKKKL